MKQKEYIKCQVGTGATCNIISLKTLNTILQEERPKLEPIKTELKLYDGTLMTPKGKCDIECTVDKTKERLENNTHRLSYFVKKSHV